MFSTLKLRITYLSQVLSINVPVIQICTCCLQSATFFLAILVGSVQDLF